MSKKDFHKYMAPLKNYIRIEATIRVLKNVDFLCHMRTDDLRSVAKFAEEVSFKAGETIFAEGDVDRDLYIIKDGEVKFTIKTETDDDKTAPEIKDIGHLFGYQYFGEGSLLTGEPRRATAVGRRGVVFCPRLSSTRDSHASIPIVRADCRPGSLLPCPLREGCVLALWRGGQGLNALLDLCQAPCRGQRFVPPWVEVSDEAPGLVSTARETAN